MPSGSRQHAQRCRQRHLDAEDPVTQGYRGEPALSKAFHLVGDKATFRPQSQDQRLPAGGVHGAPGPGMGDQTPAGTGDRVEFVHLEVWKDFEGAVLNKAAAEWVAPQDTERAAEPWVFLVDATGTITARWDNVASVHELTAALDDIVS